MARRRTPPPESPAPGLSTITPVSPSSPGRSTATCSDAENGHNLLLLLSALVEDMDRRTQSMAKATEHMHQQLVELADRVAFLERRFGMAEEGEDLSAPDGMTRPTRVLH